MANEQKKTRSTAVFGSLPIFGAMRQDPGGPALSRQDVQAREDDPRGGRR